MRREGDISAMSMEPTLQRATVVDFVGIATFSVVVAPLSFLPVVAAVYAASGAAAASVATVAAEVAVIPFIFCVQ